MQIMLFNPLNNHVKLLVSSLLMDIVSAQDYLISSREGNQTQVFSGAFKYFAPYLLLTQDPPKGCEVRIIVFTEV